MDALRFKTNQGVESGYYGGHGGNSGHFLAKSGRITGVKMRGGHTVNGFSCVYVE
mgnify:CR=1 FL=1